MGLRVGIILVSGVFAVLLVVAGFLYSRLGRADLINGSFEDGLFNPDHGISVPCKTNLDEIEVGSAERDKIARWTVFGATKLRIGWRKDMIQHECKGSDLRASDGNFFIDLAYDNETTGPTAGVEQFVVVTRPGVFELSLDVGAHPSLPAPLVEVRVEQRGATLASRTCSSTPSGNSIKWQTCTTATFPADTSQISPGATGDLRIVIRGPSQAKTTFIGVDKVVLRPLRALY